MLEVYITSLCTGFSACHIFLRGQEVTLPCSIGAFFNNHYIERRVIEIIIIIIIDRYRVFRKNCFFHNSLQPLPRSERNASVQSLLLAGIFFCTTNSSRVPAARERWQTFENSWKKHNIQ